MSDSMAAVFVTVLTGDEEDVKRATMEVHLALGDVRQENKVGVVTRAIDVNFSKEAEHGNGSEGGL